MKPRLNYASYVNNGKGWFSVIHKRFIIIGTIFLICLSVLLGRLSQIQLFETKSFTDRNINLIEESVKQRSQEMVIDNGRGKFYDRNMVPLTYEAVPSLILFPFLKKWSGM